MSSCKEAVMRQRRRELDARRSKSRVRLGSSLKRWAQLKDKLSFSLHSQLAQHLLESYVSGGHDKGETLLTSVEALQDLILMVHSHAQMCTLPPVPQSTNVKKTTDCDQSAQATGNRETEEEFGPFLSLKYTCEGGHHFLWTPINRDKDAGSGKECDVTLSGTKGRCQRNVKKRTSDFQNQERVTRCKSRQLENMINAEKMIHAWPEITKNEKYSGVTLEHQEGKDSSADFSDLEHGSPVDAGEMAGEDRLRVCSGNQSLDGQEEAAVLNLTIRENQRSSEPVEAHVIDHSAGILQNSSHGLEKKDAQIGGKRKRKPMSKVILPCEFEGCGKVFSSRQYLNHHVKFQHVQQKTFTCSHPSCSKAFNFKKHLKEHEKLHSNQRDFICEFCARAFRTSSNLIIHRRIHTGEKPLQCEVCGFTCRQKASLNWHMRKHNTESTYQFPCEICGRRFEKRDNLTAHCSKSHT